MSDMSAAAKVHHATVLQKLIWLFNRVGCLFFVHEYAGWKSGLAGRSIKYHETCLHCNKHNQLNKGTWEHRYE